VPASPRLEAPPQSWRQCGWALAASFEDAPFAGADRQGGDLGSPHRAAPQRSPPPPQRTLTARGPGPHRVRCARFGGSRAESARGRHWRSPAMAAESLPVSSFSRPGNAADRLGSCSAASDSAGWRPRWASGVFPPGRQAWPSSAACRGCHLVWARAIAGLGRTALAREQIALGSRDGFLGRKFGNGFEETEGHHIPSRSRAKVSPLRRPAHFAQGTDAGSGGPGGFQAAPRPPPLPTPEGRQKCGWLPLRPPRCKTSSGVKHVRSGELIPTPRQAPIFPPDARAVAPPASARRQSSAGSSGLSAEAADACSTAPGSPDCRCCRRPKPDPARSGPVRSGAPWPVNKLSRPAAAHLPLPYPG